MSVIQDVAYRRSRGRSTRWEDGAEDVACDRIERAIRCLDDAIEAIRLIESEKDRDAWRECHEVCRVAQQILGKYR